MSQTSYFPKIVDLAILFGLQLPFHFPAFLHIGLLELNNPVVEVFLPPVFTPIMFCFLVISILESIEIAGGRLLTKITHKFIYYKDYYFVVSGVRL